METSKKDSRIYIRFSSEEKQRIDTLRKSEGFGTISSFIRYKILNFEPKNLVSFSKNEARSPQKNSQIAVLLLSEIKKIGVNANQIAKKANNTHGASDLKILAEMIVKELRKVEELLTITNKNFENYFSRINANSSQ